MWMHRVPDARALVRTKAGVFLQRPVFRGPGNRLFFQHSGGFVCIGSHDSTSCPTLSVVALDLPFTPRFDSPLKNPLFADNDEPYSREVKP